MAAMQRSAVLSLACFVLAVVCFAIVLSGCGAAAEATYGGQLQLCVKRAKTREESRACRARVDQAWGVADGGAP